MAQKLRKKNTVQQKIVKKVKPSAGLKGGKAQAAQTVFSIPSVEYVEAVGRRKVATARVRVYKKEGDFVVNNRVVGSYFDSIPNSYSLYNKPFEVTGTAGKYA